MLEYRLLGAADVPLLEKVAQGVFDGDVKKNLAVEFLHDPRHHLCVAMDDEVIVGFVSAVHYVHPDKAPQLWINEVGVAPSHQRQGIAKALLSKMLSLGRDLRCTEAWVLTDEENNAARALYQSVDGNETHGVVMVTFPFGNQS